MTHTNLLSVDAIERFFSPDSVVVVGASQKGGFGTDILKNLKNWGFGGQLAAVNPRYEQIEEVLCYPSLIAVPFRIGLALVAIPSEAIPSVLDECEAAGVGAVQIISSGFADQGAEGSIKQAQLVEWSKRTGIPVAGPNSNGLLNARNGLIANGAAFSSMKAGGVSAVLQSGMLVSSLLMPMLARGIGIGRVVTTGNEACVDLADFINYLATDENTRVIACYCEQIKRPLEFIKACEHAADNGKPIVMIKVGRSEGARTAALAHTGSLVGSDVAIDAVLKKLGVVRVDTLDDLIETAAALSSTKRPRGPRVLFASFSGGANSILSDLAEPCGIEFPPLPGAVKERLEAILPDFATVGNPLDLTGQVGYNTRVMDEAFKAIATSGAYDLLVWGNGFPTTLDMASEVGRALECAAQAAPEVVFSVMSISGGHFHVPMEPQDAPCDQKADFDGMPFLQGAGAGLKALSSLIGYAEFLRVRKSATRLSAQWGGKSAVYPAANRILQAAKANILTEREGKKLLSLYGIPVTREALATCPEEASRIAEKLAFPVVMKVESAQIIHKTDVGGVLLNITTSENASDAYRSIVASVRNHRPGAEIAGVVVQEMASSGTEVMVGATFDPQFGPVIAIGLGGIWVEALKDVSVLLPPFDTEEVHTAIGKLRAVSVLRGARGGAKADLDGLADCIVRFGTLCTDLADEVGEIDINPIILSHTGKGLTAVDCLISKKSPPELNRTSFG